MCIIKGQEEERLEAEGNQEDDKWFTRNGKDNV